MQRTMYFCIIHLYFFHEIVFPFSLAVEFSFRCTKHKNLPALNKYEQTRQIFTVKARDETVSLCRNNSNRKNTNWNKLDASCSKILQRIGRLEQSVKGEKK